MESPSSRVSQAGYRQSLFAVVVLFALLAVAIGASYLPDPFYAVWQLAIYAGLVASVAATLRDCFRLVARGSEYTGFLGGIVLFVVGGVVGILGRIGDLVRTHDRDYIRLATDGSVYLALLIATILIKRLLKTRAPDACGDSGAAGAKVSDRET